MGITKQQLLNTIQQVKEYVDSSGSNAADIATLKTETQILQQGLGTVKADVATLQEQIESLETNNTNQNREIDQIKTDIQNLQTLIEQLELVGIQTTQKLLFSNENTKTGTIYEVNDDLSKYDYLYFSGKLIGEGLVFEHNYIFPTICTGKSFTTKDLNDKNGSVNLNQSILYPESTSPLNRTVLIECMDNTHIRQTWSRSPDDIAVSLQEIVGIKFIEAEDYSNLESQITTNTEDIQAIKKVNTEQGTTLDSLAISIQGLEEKINNLPKISDGANVAQTVLYENATHDLLPVGSEHSFELSQPITDFDYIYVAASTTQSTENKGNNNVNSLINVKDIINYNYSVPLSSTIASTKIDGRSINLAFSSPTSFFIAYTGTNLNAPTVTYMTLYRIVGLKFVPVKNEWTTYLSNRYSTEEKQIGSWINGKPLYQKSIIIDSLPNTEDKSYPHNILHVDQIWIKEGFYTYPPSSNYLPLLTVIDESGIAGQYNSYVNDTEIHIYAGLDRSNMSGVITLNYTKTTDEANSFNPELAGFLTNQEVQNEVAKILS